MVSAILRTGQYANCSHGIPWTCQCIKCDLIGAIATINRWKPVVQEAEKVVRELTERVGQTTEEQR
jgi:hypothetical protein